MEAKRKELADRSAGGAFMTLKEGNTRVRHMPVLEEQDFCIEATYFYLGDKVKGVVSAKTIGKKCPIMKKFEELSASKDPADRELASKFKPSKKYFSPVLPCKTDKASEYDSARGVKLLMIASGLYGKILDIWLDEEKGDFTDPVNGFDLKYKRSGKGKQDTEYNVLDCKPTKVPKELRQKIDINEEIKKLILPYEEAKAKLDEFLGGAIDDDDDDDRPRKKKSSSKGKIVKKKKKSRDL